MAKPRKFTIKESVLELKTLRKKQSNFKYEKRLIWLQSTISKRFKTRKQLAYYLGISSKTSERWSLKYIENGIEGLLSDKPKILRSRIITPEIHKALEAKVNSSTDPFLGYWDAQHWVNHTYGIEVKYHLLRHYLIQHFKTKLKSPRKSHYKKDVAAQEAFLKTS